MSQFTSLNVEQSVASYLSTQFQAVGYKIYWHDTEQTVGSGSVELTLLRNFPPEQNLLIKAASTRLPGTVKVPAFSVYANPPTTSRRNRMGLGEELFTWTIPVRIDGFAHTEYQWYVMQNLLKDWFTPDTRITLYDFQADINSDSPEELTQKLEFDNTVVLRNELNYVDASRYYLILNTTATFIE